MLDAHIKTKGMKETSLVSLFAQMDALKATNADIMSLVLRKKTRYTPKWHIFFIGTLLATMVSELERANKNKQYKNRRK